MTKGQIAAVFLAGAGVGAAPQAILSAVTSTATAATPHPVAHAVDLRRDYSGANFHFAVYGSRAVDAGYVDVGQAKKCILTAAQQRQLLECMGAVGSACEW